MCASRTCCTRAWCIRRRLGSTLVSAGALDKTKFPNAQVIVKGNLVGVVAPTEWEAIRAAQQVAGATKWTDWKGLPGNARPVRLPARETPIGKPPASPRATSRKGDVAPAMAAAAKKLSATYQMPFMKHAPIGPTMAVADARKDGTVYIYTHNQNPQALRGETRADAQHRRWTTSSCARSPGPATMDDPTAATPARKTKR